jgi:hypothetical protein
MQKISNGGAPYALIMSGRKKSNKNNSTARTKKNKLGDLQFYTVLCSFIQFYAVLCSCNKQKQVEGTSNYELDRFGIPR